MLDGRLLCVALSALAPAHALLARSMALRRTESARCRLLPPRVQLFNATSLFEDAVRTVTSNPEYRFGDMTKGAISELSGKDYDEYQFGDISRRFAGEAQDNVKSAVKGITGKEEYEFGDITRKVLGDADKSLADARDAYFDGLPIALWRQLFGGLTSAQRGDLIVSLVNLFALALLSLSVVINLSLAATLSVAWGIAASRSGLSPLASAAQWTGFLSTHATLGLIVNPALFPVRVFLATLLMPRYRKLLSVLQRNLPMRENEVVLNRALSMVVAWLVVNVGAVALVACGGVGLASLWVRVPVF